MGKLMERPDWIDNTYVYSLARKLNISYYTGQQVMNKFYDEGDFVKTINIPDVLKESNWNPDKEKIYKCWWFYTNPADPADPGENVLVYIEED